VRVLQENEEGLLVAFQRHIEANHPFLAVHFFLFLFRASHFFPNWLSRLREMVIDTQFPALLVNVVTQGQNRRVIEDSLTVLQIVVSGIKQTSGEVDETLFDSLASGFCVVNRQNSQILAMKDAEAKRVQNECWTHIQEMEVERELMANEISALQHHSDHDQTEISTNRERIDALGSENELLKKQLSAKKRKLSAVNESLHQTASEVNNMTLRVAKSEQLIDLKDHKSAKMKTRIQSLKDADVERQSHERKVVQLEHKIADLEARLSESRQEVERAIELAKRERARKKETQAILHETQERVNVLASQYDEARQGREEAEKQNGQFEVLLKRKTASETKFSETIVGLQASIERVNLARNQTEGENSDLRMIIEKQRQQISRLRKQRNELIAVAQLIHRVTEGKLSTVTEST
jgi:chromosome segregation ATPase